MSDRKTVLGNWKMNTSSAEAVGLATSLKEGVRDERVEIGVAPPFVWLDLVSRILRDSPIRVGAQTCAATGNGAYTGEVSAAMIAELCQFVLIGHSERRRLFGETDEVVREKLHAVLEFRERLQPVLCVGETLEQRHAGSAEAVVTQQLTTALDGINRDLLADLLIAYEPVWAIGTGQTATPADASAMGGTVGEVLSGLGLRDVPVLYGGSVTAQNADSLIAAPNVDGFLVGGASLKADEFQAIVASARD